MGTETNNTGENKITFDEAQQKRIDELIREAQGRAAKDVRTELDTTKSTLTSLQSELAEAKSALAAAGTKKDKEDNKSEVERLQAEIAEIKRAHATVTQDIDRYKKLASEKDKAVTEAQREASDIKRRVAIQSAAGKVGFFDVDDVTRLTEDTIKFDDTLGRFVVLGDNGQPRLNSAIEPMTLEEYYTEFASKRPYMVRSDVRNGTGASQNQRVGNNGRFTVEQVFGAKSDGALANQLKKSDPAQYAQLKKFAKENGII